MAVYVKMIKMIDDEKRVIYQFGPNGPVSRFSTK